MTDSSQRNESRRDPRYPVEVRVRVSFTKDGFLQRATVRAIDISTSGISVVSPLPLPKDSGVEVEISLPGVRSPIRVKSVIRNRNGARYGVEFLSTTELQKEDIKQFGIGRKPSSGVGASRTTLPAVN